jgi:hypothetical protein
VWELKRSAGVVEFRLNKKDVFMEEAEIIGTRIYR